MSAKTYIFFALKKKVYTSSNQFIIKEILMSNTLVIHPKDDSTIMLKEVYKGKGFDVISDYTISREDLLAAINSHDRIIMLGHGTPQGLIDPRVKSPNEHTNRMYLIDDTFAEALRNKETISVWCMSDEFFRRNNISGFHTGMIISERQEANYFLGHCPLTDKQLFDSMVNFAKIIHDCIDMSPLEMKRFVLDHYVGDDDITQFNRERIIVL